jgi:hypothetical protein
MHPQDHHLLLEFEFFSKNCICWRCPRPGSKVTEIGKWLQSTSYQTWDNVFASLAPRDLSDFKASEICESCTQLILHFNSMQFMFSEKRDVRKMCRSCLHTFFITSSAIANVAVCKLAFRKKMKLEQKMVPRKSPCHCSLLASALSH